MTGMQIQHLLAYLGYAPGDCDGIVGRNTIDAVRRFQADYGLRADGDPGAATQKMLIGAVAGTAVRVDKPADSTQPKTGTFWDGIKYFSRDEPGIRCPCSRCGGFPVEPTERLMRLADSVREQAGVPMNPSSTIRCQAHNDELQGSARNSRHLSGRAMDFSLRGWTSAQTLALVKQQPGVHYAYAIDGSYVHMDVD